MEYRAISNRAQQTHAESVNCAATSGAPAARSRSEARKNWFELWYQPKIDLATMRLAGAEGLVRVRHPKHGVIFPGQFLPGAREEDMLALTEQVILTALRDWDVCRQRRVAASSRSTCRSPR